jgi:hypothetical protein
MMPRVEGVENLKLGSQETLIPLETANTVGKIGAETALRGPQTQRSLKQIDQDMMTIPVLGERDRAVGAYDTDLATARRPNIPVVVEAEGEDALTRVHKNQADRYAMPDLTNAVVQEAITRAATATADRSTLGVRTDATREKAELDIAQNRGTRGNLPNALTAQDAQNIANIAGARNKERDEAIAAATYPDRKYIAEQMAGFEARNLPTRQLVELRRLKDDYENVEGDLARARKLKEFQLKAQEANIELTRARTGAALQGKPGVDPMIAQKRIIDSIKSIERTKVGEEEFHVWLKNNLDPATGQLRAGNKGETFWGIDALNPDTKAAAQDPVAIGLFNRWRALHNDLAGFNNAAAATNSLQNQTSSASNAPAGWIRGADGILRRQ